MANIGVKKVLITLIRYYKSSIDDDMDDNLFAKPIIIQKNPNDGRPEVGIIVLFAKFGLTETNKKYLKFLIYMNLHIFLVFTRIYIKITKR